MGGLAILASTVAEVFFLDGIPAVLTLKSQSIALTSVPGDFFSKAITSEVSAKLLSFWSS